MINGRRALEQSEIMLTKIDNSKRKCIKKARGFITQLSSDCVPERKSESEKRFSSDRIERKLCRGSESWLPLRHPVHGKVSHFQCLHRVKSVQASQVVELKLISVPRLNLTGARLMHKHQAGAATDVTG